MRARSSALHTRTPAFSISKMKIMRSSNLILDLGRWDECMTILEMGPHDWEKLW
jgi:hypothetical protein